MTYYPQRKEKFLLEGCDCGHNKCWHDKGIKWMFGFPSPCSICLCPKFELSEKSKIDIQRFEQEEKDFNN